MTFLDGGRGQPSEELIYGRSLGELYFRNAVVVGFGRSIVACCIGGGIEILDGRRRVVPSIFGRKSHHVRTYERYVLFFVIRTKLGAR